MFNYRNRALLWVLLLMMILPVSAFAAQEMDSQVATDDQKSHVANESLSEGDNPTASGDQKDELNEINDEDDGDNDDGDNDDGDNDDGDNDDGDNDDGDNDDGDNDDGDNDDGDNDDGDNDDGDNDDGDNDDGDNDDGDNDDGDNDDGDNDDGDNDEDDGDNDDGDNDEDDGDNDDGDNDDDDGDDDDDDDNDLKVYGLIESFPSDLVGDWVVGGVTYTANASTQFEQEHGAFAVGSCVEVKYQSNGASNTATKIESEETNECSGDDDDDGDNDDGDNDDGDNDDGDDDDGDDDDGDDDDGDGDDDDDNDLKVYGLIESFPSELVGDWVIGGTTYTANANTEFEQEHGAFAVGTCVEIEYLPTSNQALEIESEHSYKCDGSGGSGQSYSQTKGVVESYPSALIGTWVIDGVSYTASASTRFEQEDGPFFVGGCVEIKYVASDSSAVEIESEEAHDCGGNSGSGSSNSRSKLYGLIETLPSDLVGSWTVGGTNFEATSSTRFEQEHGNFAVGMCVEVTYTTADNANTATEIETEDAYHCSGGSSTNQIYGTADSFPTDLYGTWVVSGISYVASPSTQFEQDDGAFAVGNCVKVRYYTQNGVNQATKIESENSECSGSSSNSSQSSTNKVYATIDSFPSTPYVGTWQIGGLTYEAANSTEFDQDHGAFAVGTCVEAKYSVNNSSNTLIEVETENSYKCGSSEQGQFTVYGTVEAMPTATDRTGTWQISGITHQANSGTLFEQEYGFFAVGSYVEVKYQMDGQATNRQMGGQTATALSIETHVAPGSGLQTDIGTLESHDANDDWNDWVIAGVTYKADPAIEVGSGVQAPQVGELVSFNSYQNNNTHYLTDIQSLPPTAVTLGQVTIEQSPRSSYWLLITGVMMMGILIWRRRK